MICWRSLCDWQTAHVLQRLQLLHKSLQSRRVSALESFLGGALLRRKARRLELTSTVRAEARSAITIARDSLESPLGQAPVTRHLGRGQAVSQLHLGG
eukprot:gene42985-53337_t